MAKREEKQSEDFIIGRNASLEVLKGDRDVNKVFIQEKLDDRRIDEIEQAAKKRRLIVNFVPKSKLDKLSNNQAHQGVVVAVSATEYATLDDLFAVADGRNEEPFFILLDELEDPHNLGAIMRTADAAGAHGIVITKHRAVGLTSTVSKASAGAIEHVKVARVTNMVDTIKSLKDRGMWIFGTDIEGEPLRKWNASGAVAIVIGNEGSGMSRLVKENVDGMVTIPMSGHVQSLNASVAAALVMYEVFQQRQE